MTQLQREDLWSLEEYAVRRIEYRRDGVFHCHLASTNRSGTRESDLDIQAIQNTVVVDVYPQLVGVLLVHIVSDVVVRGQGDRTLGVREVCCVTGKAR